MDKNINLFFGKNGAGKSNFFKIFHFLKKLENDNDENDNQLNYDNYANEENLTSLKDDILIEIKSNLLKKNLTDLSKELIQLFRDFTFILNTEYRKYIRHSYNILQNNIRRIDTRIIDARKIDARKMNINARKDIQEFTNTIHFFSIKVKLKSESKIKKNLVFWDKESKKINLKTYLIQKINFYVDQLYDSRNSRTTPPIKIIKKFKKMIQDIQNKYLKLILKEKIKF